VIKISDLNHHDLDRHTLLCARARTI